MTDGEAIYGRVRNGAIELAAPLDLPDGTPVIIDVIEPHEVPGAAAGPLPPEVVKEIMIGLTGRTDLVDDPDWKDKIVRPRE